MKSRFVLGCLGLLLACDPTKVSTAPFTAIAAIVKGPGPTSSCVDFGTQIRPLLESRCQPCHFAGGKLYAQLPFHRERTIRDLGEKLFTRIKEPDEQALMRRFLAQIEDVVR